MTTLRKRLLIGLVAAGFGAGSAAAFADKPDCGPMGFGVHARGGERMNAYMERRLSDLHGKLKLNASQENAWRSYADKMKPADMPARPDRDELDKLPTPERMEKMQALMKDREQHMTTRVAATKEFYAVLTPEQRKIFDEQFRFGQGRHQHMR